MIPLLRGQRQAHSPSAGTAEYQMPSLLSWGIGRAATLLKTLLQYFGKSSCQVLPTPESGTTGCEKKTKVEDVSIRMYLSKNRICIRHVLYANLNSAKPTKQQMKHIQVLQGVKKNCLLQCSCCDNSGNYLLSLLRF